MFLGDLGLNKNSTDGQMLKITKRKAISITMFSVWRSPRVAGETNGGVCGINRVRENRSWSVFYVRIFVWVWSLHGLRTCRFSSLKTEPGLHSEPPVQVFCSVIVSKVWCRFTSCITYNYKVRIYTTLNLSGFNLLHVFNQKNVSGYRIRKT